MLTIHTLPLGIFQTNTYVLENDGACIVIDPGYDHHKILDFIAQRNLNLCAILLTHGHFDHVGAVRALAAEADCSVYIHEDDLSLPATFTAGAIYYTDIYGSYVQAAGLDIQILHTPGHTPGSVCLITEDVLISGDTLFAGSCGRTDLPGGDWAQLFASLRKIAALDKDYRVFPGHGPSTTLMQEKEHNPYFH